MELGDLTDYSLRYTEAIANYNIMKVIAGVFMIVFLVTFVIFVYQYISAQKKLTSCASFSKQALAFFKDTSMRQASIDQSRGLISSELDKSRAEIVLQIIKMKQKNNLVDTDMIAGTINAFIDKCYSSNINLLRKFDYQGKAISTYMESSWKETIRRQMLKDCEEHEFDADKLDQIYSNHFDLFKNIFNSKIDDKRD